jgi:hypothetical protein
MVCDRAGALFCPAALGGHDPVCREGGRAVRHAADGLGRARGSSDWSAADAIVASSDTRFAVRPALYKSCKAQIVSDLDSNGIDYC